MTARNLKKGRLQARVEVPHFSPYLNNSVRIKALDDAWQRALKFHSSIWIYKAQQICIS